MFTALLTISCDESLLISTLPKISMEYSTLLIVGAKVNLRMLTRFRCWMCLHVTIALADAIASITNVTVTKLNKENSIKQLA